LTPLRRSCAKPTLTDNPIYIVLYLFKSVVRINIKLPNLFKRETRYSNASNNKSKLKSLNNIAVELKVFLKNPIVQFIYMID